MTRQQILAALETQFAVFHSESIPYGVDDFGDTVHEAFYVRNGAVWRVLCSATTFEGECSIEPWHAFNTLTAERWADAPCGDGEPPFNPMSDYGVDDLDLL
jgi:hypothetical protein